MAGEAELFCSGDGSRWRVSLDSYQQTLALVASRKKRSTDSDSLTHLDKWYQTELPASIASRSKPHLTLEELCKLMKWKLTRGKFRPRLTEMVRQNSSEDVERVTGAAIAALSDLERAVSLATQLRAIGPATASAILCAACRDVPFMADEVALSVTPSLGKLTYSLKQYLTYASVLRDKARKLSSGGEKVWSAHEVELALWSHHHSDTLAPLSGKRKEREPADDSPSTTTDKRAKLSDCS